MAATLTCLVLDVFSKENHLLRCRTTWSSHVFRRVIGPYLDWLLARRLGLVVLGLLVLLAPLGQVGVVGQAAEQGRHHGAGVHLLLQGKQQRVGVSNNQQTINQ